jgi:hypothetical protein
MMLSAAEVEAKQKAAEEDKKKAAAEEEKKKLAAALAFKTASSEQAAEGKSSDEQATTGFCNHTGSVFFFLSLFTVIENKSAFFVITHFSLLQSLSTQVCYHIPNNQVAFQPQTNSGSFFFASFPVLFFCFIAFFLQLFTYCCCNHIFFSLFVQSGICTFFAITMLPRFVITFQHT